MKTYQKFAEIYDDINPTEFYELYHAFIHVALEQHHLRPESILELGCGTGRLAEQFILEGKAVDGLDRSPQMLAIAKKRGVRTRQGDLASFRLSKRYDLIFCALDSLNYLLTERALRSSFMRVHQHLSNGGLFIFDLNSEFKINKAVLAVPPTTIYNFGDVKLTWTNSHRQNTWVIDLILREKGKTFREQHVEKAYALPLVKQLLRHCGFQVLGIYGDLAMGEVQKDSLKWFFVCAKKRDAPCENVDLGNVFGSIKTGESGQKFKDRAREGWGKE